MAYQYDYDESYDWEPPAEKVHSYGSPASSRGYRDPQVLADPTSLGYDDSYRSPAPARRNQPYGAVNPNFVYPAAQAPAHPRTHSAYDPEQGGVMREQYCICSPKTDFERRLLVTVVVLSVVCVALLATLFGFMPSIMCGKACADENGGGGSLADLLPFMGTRIERMLPG